MTETEWQAQVVEAAHLFGWNHLHVRRTLGKGKTWVTSTNRKGWPDLFLWHREHGFLAIELKVGRNTATPEQMAVLDELLTAGARVAVAYPEDWPSVERLLRGDDGAGSLRPLYGTVRREK